MNNSVPIAAYENNAKAFLRGRDQSEVGIEVAKRWAQTLEPGAEVIELACGGGFPVTQTLNDVGLKLWAIDGSPSLVSVFQSRFPDIPIACESVLTSDYFGKQFDAAIAIGLLFLLFEKEQRQLLDRVSNTLKPGGSFLLTAPIERGDWTDCNTGHQCFSLGEEVYRATFQQSGFRVIGCFEDRGKNNYYQLEKLT